MGLSREVDHVIDFLYERFAHLRIAYIAFDKAITRIVLNPFQVSEVSRIGELVEVDDAITGVLVQYIPDKVAANKAATSSNQHCLHNNIPFVENQKSQRVNRFECTRKDRPQQPPNNAHSKALRQDSVRGTCRAINLISEETLQ